MFAKSGCLAPILALVLSVSTVHAADLPPASVSIVGWPRMTSGAFGCLMEKTLGHRDPKFNCDLRDYRPATNPCTDAGYNEGPKFPPTLATRIHPLATHIDVDFEHGDVRAVSVQLAGKFSDAEVRKAFGLPDDDARPPNIMHISVQDCGLGVTCLSLQGFDHLGAGDVDCGKQR